MTNTQVSLGLTTLAMAALITSCGGGGGGGTNGGGITPPTSGPTPTPTVTNTPGATTNASGTVVSDANGSPIAGIQVKLMPWGNGPGTCSATPVPSTSITPENDGCPTPLPAPQATTNASGQFTLANAPNGHYLLVIGTDAVSTPPAGYAPPACTTACPTPSPAPFTVTATVHDNVTLTGGTQTLHAPTLPTVTAGYTPPAWETNGTYRIATLDASTEMPCYIAWEYERAQHNVAGSSVDEWITENTRAINGSTLVGPTNGTKLTTGNTQNGGGTDCANSLVNFLTFSGADPYSTDPRTLWFGGQYEIFSAFGGTNNEATGIAEYPIDPRSFLDPIFPNWP